MKRTFALSLVVGLVLAVQSGADGEPVQANRCIYPIGDLLNPTSGAKERDKVEAAASCIIAMIRQAAPDTEIKGSSPKSVRYISDSESLVVSQTPEAQERIQLALDRLREYRMAIDPKSK